MAPSLCQPGGGASCGACCGLYNFKDHSRAALTSALARRTESVRASPRTPEGFREAAARTRSGDASPLFPAVRVCPLLGFLDEEQSRVGCLAHPAVTGGPDLRDCGVYNADTCATFECPSFLWLSDDWAALVRDACADWYLYGLVVTDVDFIRGCRALLERELARPVGAAELARPGPLALLRALFALKEEATGREGGAAVFGRFDPSADDDVTLRTLDYRALGALPAPEDDVVLCLGHTPGSAPALQAARAQVRERVQALARALA